MEAQEFGEMMEHADEVNFALDGLKKDQPVRIRRASLSSFLSICDTQVKRRLLRAQGMVKKILDAILSLSLDDSLSTLAAATLFYVLASDGDDEQLLDSPSCIRFLLKLLNPSVPVTSEEKRPTIGCKILALRRDPDTLGHQSKNLDASSNAIISKVEDILLNCEEIKSSNIDEGGMGRPELTSKWIALLTIEKACLSTVSIEDTSATIRKAGGNFKETLRDLGGLDAVFDVATSCHSIMKRWSNHKSPSSGKSKDEEALQTVVLLLKCLKIMENATFLSKDNQNHVLGMTGKSGCEGCLSFTSLVTSVIKILSGILLQQSSSVSSKDKSDSHSDCMGCASRSSFEEDDKVEQNGNLSENSSKRSSIMDKAADVEIRKTYQKRKKLSTSPVVYVISSSETSPVSEDASASRTESSRKSKKRQKFSTLQRVYTVSSSGTSSFSTNPSVTEEDKPSTSSSCNGTSKSSKGKPSKNTKCIGMGRKSRVDESTKCISLEDSQDPFAFDEEEIEPSKWDLLSTRKDTSQDPKNRGTVRGSDSGCNPSQRINQSKLNNDKECHSCEIAWSASVQVISPNLLADCLLAAVKVLMNLTNDNPVGCKQIASCGGLEVLSALISGHYPSYSSTSSLCSQAEDSIAQLECGSELQSEDDNHFTDQEIDFLVAILGLLVNLVEKDNRNRSRLAATSVSVSSSGGSERTNNRKDVIPLLCSIFLANQGAGETSGEGKLMPWDDENAVSEGEREAEKMIIEAYTALLLAFLSKESKHVRDAIARCLPDRTLEVLVPVLERFVAFHLQLNMISPETHKLVSEVIESCRESGDSDDSL